MSTPLEFVIRALFGFGEENKWKLLRVWKDVCVLKNKVTGNVIGMCGTNRGRPGFNGFAIAYVASETGRLMVTDVPKSEMHSTIEALSTSAVISTSTPDEDALALILKWISQIPYVQVNVTITVGDTPQFTAVEALVESRKRPAEAPLNQPPSNQPPPPPST